MLHAAQQYADICAAAYSAIMLHRSLGLRLWVLDWLL